MTSRGFMLVHVSEHGRNREGTRLHGFSQVPLPVEPERVLKFRSRPEASGKSSAQ